MRLDHKIFPWGVAAPPPIYNLQTANPKIYAIAEINTMHVARLTSHVARKSFSVAMPRGSHPFPSRTRKLSPSGPMVLHGQLCGRVGRRRDLICKPVQSLCCTGFFACWKAMASSSPYLHSYQNLKLQTKIEIIESGDKIQLPYRPEKPNSIEKIEMYKRPMIVSSGARLQKNRSYNTGGICENGNKK